MAEFEPHESASARPRVFLTGASGYVGGRLATRLLEAGYSITCLVRQPRKVATRVWAKDRRVSIVEGDLTDVAATAEAMRGCTAAFYLVHSMNSAGRAYAERDRAIAAVFADAAARARLERIIYLGGLGETGDALSPHLASRLEVGRILAAGAVPTTILRAGMMREFDVLTRGSAWVEESTGRVLQTELQIRHADGVTTIKTTFKMDDRLQVMVPASMQTTKPEGRATYSNFRRFIVEIDEAIESGFR